MINRDDVEKCLIVLEKLANESADMTISSSGHIELEIYPKNWYYSAVQWSDEKRHEVLSLVTPLVGRMEKQVDGTNIGYRGEKEKLTIRMNYVDKCKVLGYKKVTKTVQKEIEREPEYETVEEEIQVPITDCDIRQGKFKEEDIEVEA